MSPGMMAAAMAVVAVAEDRFMNCLSPKWTSKGFNLKDLSTNHSVNLR